MTRINLVPPSELTDKHLLAEYRELPRVYSLALKRHRRWPIHQSFADCPSKFKLGKGHMLFFVNKLSFLHRRHLEIIGVMLDRGFKPRFTGKLPAGVADLPECYFGNYTPTHEAIELSRARINERLEDAKARKAAASS